MGGLNLKKPNKTEKWLEIALSWILATKTTAVKLQKNMFLINESNILHKK